MSTKQVYPITNKMTITNLNIAKRSSHQRTTSSPPSSFHQFSSLPMEIRLKIWSHSFPPPSESPFLNVKASYEILPSPPSNDDDDDGEAATLPSHISYTFHLERLNSQVAHRTSQEYLPRSYLPIIQTCREARDLYLSEFDLTSSLPTLRRQEGEGRGQHSRGKILYSPKSSTVYLRGGLFFHAEEMSYMNLPPHVFGGSTDLIDAWATSLGFATTSAATSSSSREKIHSTLHLRPASFFENIRNLALTFSHFNNYLFQAFNCDVGTLYSIPSVGVGTQVQLERESEATTTTGEDPQSIAIRINEGEEKGEEHLVPARTVWKIGRLFSSFRKIEHLWMIFEERLEGGDPLLWLTPEEWRSCFQFYSRRMEALLECYVEKFVEIDDPRSGDGDLIVGGEESRAGEGREGNREKRAKWKAPKIGVREDGRKLSSGWPRWRSLNPNPDLDRMSIYLAWKA